MSKRASGRASGPVLQSVFMAVIDHSGGVESKRWEFGEDESEKQAIGAKREVGVIGDLNKRAAHYRNFEEKLDVQK